MSESDIPVAFFILGGMLVMTFAAIMSFLNRLLDRLHALEERLFKLEMKQ